jgi:hypothetical protein
MQIDTGLVIVVFAVLIFYLRLIVLQRERARQVRRQLRTPGTKQGKGARAQSLPARSGPVQSARVSQFSILSRDRRDWIIAGIGIMLIVIGILMARGIMPYSWSQPNWWLPVAVGILAFSWGFK